MILLVDNYCSFTFNVAHLLSACINKDTGDFFDICTYRNNDISLSQIEALNPSHIVIGPGPSSPIDAGISLSIVQHLKGVYPILGVCLGHQVIGEAFGAKITRAKQPIHGKAAYIYHKNIGVFNGLPTPCLQARYHSLLIEKNSLPDDLDVTAWTQTDLGFYDEIMGIRHHKYQIEGVQCHPESILSIGGQMIFENFLSVKN